MSIFKRTKKMAPAEAAPTRRRFWKRKKIDGKKSVTKEKRDVKMKVMEWRATGAERLAIARAKLQERAEHLGGWMQYRWFAFTHCIHPFRRRAAKRARNLDKLRATDKRKQKEFDAHSKAAAKRQRYREARVAKLNENSGLLK